MLEEISSIHEMNSPRNQDSRRKRGSNMALLFNGIQFLILLQLLGHQCIMFMCMEVNETDLRNQSN